MGDECTEHSYCNGISLECPPSMLVSRSIKDLFLFVIRYAVQQIYENSKQIVSIYYITIIL